MSILKDKQLEGLYVVTASTNLNEVTFTKGNGDEFTVTVDTGSSGNNVTADNGLTKTGDNIQLGGDLIQNTTINGKTNSFFLNNAKGIQLEAVNEGRKTQIFLDNSQINIYTPKIDSGDAYVGQILVLQDAENGSVEFETNSSGPIFKETKKGTDVTGTLSPLPTYTLLIPGGTFTKGNIIRIHYRAYKKQTSNSSFIRMYIGTDPDFNFSTLIAASQSGPSSKYLQMKRDIIIPSDGSSPHIISPKYNGFSDDVETNDLEFLNIDWGQSQYLFFAAQNTKESDTITGYSYYIEKL